MFSENEKKVSKQLETIISIPTIDSWLIKYQNNLYNKNTGSDINIYNIQLDHLYKYSSSLMPIVNADQLKNITLNTWS